MLNVLLFSDLICFFIIKQINVLLFFDLICFFIINKQMFCYPLILSVSLLLNKCFVIL